MLANDNAGCLFSGKPASLKTLWTGFNRIFMYKKP